MKDIYFVDEGVPAAVKSFRFELCEVEAQSLRIPLEIERDVRVINFHGRPKPHELAQVPWVRQHWR